MPVFVISINELLRTFVPGSADWSWEEEFQDLETRDSELLREIEDSIRRYGQIEPIELGNDGRVWDGHHRILVMRRLDQTHIRAIQYD